MCDFIIENGVLFKCKTDEKTVEIPDGVTVVAENAFTGCRSLECITIPSSVSKIEKCAFYGCKAISAVYITDLAVWCQIGSAMSRSYLGVYDLYWNGELLTDLVIPENVTQIGERAFEGCRSLIHLTIPETVTQIGNGAFKTCTNLASICIASSITSIAKEAFWGCHRLETIILPASVTHIEKDGFYACDAPKKIFLSDLTAWCGIQYENVGSLFGTYTLYLNGEPVTNPVWPESMTVIPERVFSGCQSLVGITMGNNVTHIGNGAFYNCQAITDIAIPSSVTGIGKKAFWGCSALTDITIPAAVTVISEQTFQNCKSLAHITLPSGVTVIDDNAFSGCESMTTFTVPESVSQIGKDAFAGCKSLKEIHLPNEALLRPMQSDFYGYIGPLYLKGELVRREQDTAKDQQFLLKLCSYSHDYDGAIYQEQCCQCHLFKEGGHYYIERTYEEYREYELHYEHSEKVPVKPEDLMMTKPKLCAEYCHGEDDNPWITTYNIHRDSDRPMDVTVWDLIKDK